MSSLTDSRQSPQQEGFVFLQRKRKSSKKGTKYGIIDKEKGVEKMLT